MYAHLSKFSGARFAGISTRQTTCYHIGDDGDQRRVIDSSYQAGIYSVLTAGAFSSTANIDVPHYAGSGLAFVSGTKKITDSASGLAIYKTGDTILVKGSASNSGVLTVATGNVAGEIVTTEALTTEGAGAYMTIFKRAALSNNCVLCADSPSGKMYARYTTGGPALKLGDASDGKLNWYDATKCFTLHPAAADLQMIAGGLGAATLRIINGAGEIARYSTGTILVCSGFVNAVNNLPGYRVTAVAANGADLDITLMSGKQTAISEAAAGSRTIKVICSSVFGFAAAAKAASLGGYTDWVVPMDLELKALCDMETGDAAPDTTVFPSWPTSDRTWSTVTVPNSNSFANIQEFDAGRTLNVSKTSLVYAALVRGG